MEISSLIARAVLIRLGYREPEKHPQWAAIVRDVVSLQPPSDLSVKTLLHYEIRSSWLSFFVWVPVVGTLVSGVMYRRVMRKLKNFDKYGPAPLVFENHRSNDEDRPEAEIPTIR